MWSPFQTVSSIKHNFVRKTFIPHAMCDVCKCPIWLQVIFTKSFHHSIFVTGISLRILSIQISSTMFISSSPLLRSYSSGMVFISLPTCLALSNEIRVILSGIWYFQGKSFGRDGSKIATSSERSRRRECCDGRRLITNNESCSYW